MSIHIRNLVWYLLECEVQLKRMLPRVGASLVAQRVERLPAMLETRVQSLGQEDPLEKGMATHSSILAWRNPKDRGA